MLIATKPAKVFEAFVRPDLLTQFWLASAAAPLEIGRSVLWKFRVPGAQVETTATRLIEGKAIEWSWSNGTTVSIELEEFGTGTAVTLVNEGFPGSPKEQLEAALNATEGFSLVLADLKTFLETGTSAGITRAKATLIEARSAATR
jgi:uncharacterized protein YndB with AHSA1/START domain